MDKYVITEPRDSSDNQDLIDDNVDGDNMNAHRIDDDNVDDDTVNVDGVSHTDVDVGGGVHGGYVSVDNDDINLESTRNDDGTGETDTCNVNVDNPNANVDHVNIFDPRNWDSLSSDMIKALVEGEHITNVATWFDMRGRLKKNEAIDNVVHEQFEKERYHRMKVLLRIISIVKFLAKHNLAFRGSAEKLHVDSNGNF
nr:zinc finger MYM-type protein 1-like [Tanacetum cinerariifolium]